MALGVVVAPSFTNNAQAAAASEKTVYVDVEKNVLGESPLIKPVKVTLDDSKTILDATKQADPNIGIDATTGQYAYIKAFQDNSDNQADFQANYPSKFYDKLDTVTKGVIFKNDILHQPIITDTGWLREKECDGVSGWTFTVNDSQTYGSNGTYYTAATALSNVPDNAVIRWEFSAAMGADLGIANSAYLPTEVTDDGYYNWDTSVYVAPLFERVSKSDLIRDMANYENKNDENYKAALTTLQTLQATQDQVDEAIKGLSPASTGANMAVSGL
ncbi:MULTISPECIES: hypothetical protein [Clostridium]|uniref:Uncharacterized protein n=2 Tax=Clostridium TaxID=1485 RepID=A0ABV4DTK8_9CLOT